MRSTKKLAIISGASSGIGKSFAYSLSANGYDLVLIARRKKLLDAIAADLQKKYNSTVIVHATDLTSEIQRRNLIAGIQKNHRSVDLLINSAGFGKFGTSPDVGAEQAKKMINVNITALTELCLSLIPQLLKSKEKSIINIASVASFHPSIYGGVYAATKAYVYSFSMALAAEYDGRLHVLTLCPGLTRTGFWKVANVAPPKLFLSSPEKVVEKALASLGRRNLLVIGYENHARIFFQKLLSDQVVLNLTMRSMNIMSKSRKQKT